MFWWQSLCCGASSLCVWTVSDIVWSNTPKSLFSSLCKPSLQDYELLKTQWLVVSVSAVVCCLDFWHRKDSQWTFSHRSSLTCCCEVPHWALHWLLTTPGNVTLDATLGSIKTQTHAVCCPLIAVFYVYVFQFVRQFLVFFSDSSFHDPDEPTRPLELPLLLHASSTESALW